MEQVKLENTGEIELPTADVSDYIGVKSQIENVLELEGNYGYFIRLETKELGPLKDSNGKPITDKDGKVKNVRATRLFGLQEDAEGNVGWGEKTKLGVFLKKMKVDHYKALKGQGVIVQSVTNTNDGKDYLTFN